MELRELCSQHAKLKETNVYALEKLKEQIQEGPRIELSITSNDFVITKSGDNPDIYIPKAACHAFMQVGGSCPSNLLGLKLKASAFNISCDGSNEYKLANLEAGDVLTIRGTLNTLGTSKTQACCQLSTV